jgi:hypothetical protein
MNTKLFFILPLLLLSGLLGMDNSAAENRSLISICGKGVTLGLVTYFGAKTAHSLFKKFSDQDNYFASLPSSLKQACIENLNIKYLKNNFQDILYAASAGAHICCLRETKKEKYLKATLIVWITTTFIKAIQETESKELDSLFKKVMISLAPSKLINKSFLSMSEQKPQTTNQPNQQESSGPNEKTSISKNILSKLPCSQHLSLYWTPLFLILWNSYQKKTLTILSSSKKETLFQLSQFFQYGLLLDLVAGSSSLENTSKIFICNFLASLQKENYDLADFFKLLGTLEALSKGIKDNF